MEHKKFLVAPPDASVSDAAKLMAKKNVGAVLVVDNERLIGIFTERDAVFRVIAHGRDAKTTRRSAWRLLWRKLSGGPGAYEGLWLLIGNIYGSLATDQPPPIAMTDMFEINRLVAELQNEGNRI